MRSARFFIVTIVYMLSCGSNALVHRDRSGKFQQELEACQEVPQRLVFNYKTNLLQPKGNLGEHDARLAENVADSVKLFSDVQDVEFADDAECKAAIEEAHSKQLANFYDTESHGCYKSDLCRLAQLYLRGGYYLDNDIQPLYDFRSEMPPCTNFLSAISTVNGVFQAVLGAAPKHPVIARALNLTLQHYLDFQKQPWRRIPQAVGTKIMESAVKDVSGVESVAPGSLPGGILLLEERGPEPDRYESHQDSCNNAVWHGDKQLFWSRSISHFSGERCEHKETITSTAICSTTLNHG
jgi:hypothetical protein